MSNSKTGKRRIGKSSATPAQNDEWQSFDRETDPADQRNLYGKSGYDDITGDLKRRLQALRAQYQVPERDPEAAWYHGAVVRALEQLMLWLF